jgi:hypothetical protein
MPLTVTLAKTPAVNAVELPTRGSCERSGSPTPHGRIKTTLQETYAMMKLRFTALATLAFLASTVAAACSDSGSATTQVDPGSSGTLVVRLTDAPFLTDSVKSVSIFVVRIDARISDADSASADHAFDDDSSKSEGWKSVASPNAAFDLLSLQNGVAATLGQASLGGNVYKGLRLIIDPTKSSVTLKNGSVLTSISSPSVTFPSASRSGIKISLSQPLTIVAGATTTLLVDFNVNDSFVMRGNSINQNGLLFKPVIKATITNSAPTGTAG